MFPMVKLLLLKVIIRDYTNKKSTFLEVDTDLKPLIQAQIKYPLLLKKEIAIRKTIKPSLVFFRNDICSESLHIFNLKLNRAYSY